MYKCLHICWHIGCMTLNRRKKKRVRDVKSPTLGKRWQGHSCQAGRAHLQTPPERCQTEETESAEQQPKDQTVWAVVWEDESIKDFELSSECNEESLGGFRHCGDLIDPLFTFVTVLRKHWKGHRDQGRRWFRISSDMVNGCLSWCLFLLLWGDTRTTVTLTKENV